MDVKPTLKELSAMTNVSMATISRALSSPEKVKYSTRKKIENAISEYKNQKSKQSSGTIGLVVPDITNQFFPLMLTGIDNIASGNGMTIMLCNSNGIPRREDEILKKLIDIGVDGIIMIPSGQASLLLQQIVKEQIVPIVFLDRDPGLHNINLVTTGNFEGLYQATKYLITLGHKRILYLGGTLNTSTEVERCNGFRAAMSDNEIEIRDDFITHADFNFCTAQSLIEAMLKENRFNFSAICAANDVMALGAVKALQSNKIRIPEDVSIIGYDNIPSAEYGDLTTVKQPFIEMGTSAMFQLMSTINDPYLPPKTIVLSTSIIFRNSCKILLP